jgi:hypothetical protein
MQNLPDNQNFDKKEYSFIESETGEITQGPKNIKRKCSYKKINNHTRQQLIEMVNFIFNFFHLGVFKGLPT